MTSIPIGTDKSTVAERMESTLANGRRVRHYRSPPTVTPEAWLAKALGRSPGGVHQLLEGPFRCGLTLPDLTALCIRGFVATDSTLRLTRWVAPIRAALADIRTLPLTPELIREAQLVDLEEDMIEAEYHAAPTAMNARRWVAWIDRCIDYLLKLRAALVAEHNLKDDQ